jgi:tetratricopeptide (TPR) repeat protein
MSLENLSMNPFVFTVGKDREKRKQPYSKQDTNAKISLAIFKKLECQDLCQARLACKEWKQLIEQTNEWKNLYSKKFITYLSQESPQSNHIIKSESKKSLLKNEDLNNFGKKKILVNSILLTDLPLKIFEQIFLSFNNLNNDELKKLLDARSCARVLRQRMPGNIKFLTKYYPKKLQSYFKKILTYQNNITRLNGQTYSLLSIERIEEAYALALKHAIQKKDPIQEGLYIEKLGDVYLRKGTQTALLQATGLYNYVLYLSTQDKQQMIKERLFKAQCLLTELCKGEPISLEEMRKQFENNREVLKNFRQEIEKKLQTLPESPSSEEVKELYDEIARKVKSFFEYLAMQAFCTLGPAPCEYAMIGFGSLAREEITPYSDLEFGILIQEDTLENRDYFKRLTYVIQLKTINLGETILPALNIPCLKDIDFFDCLTPRGFAFDNEGLEKACKTPFGNRHSFELIQTPEKMAQYIAKDEEGHWWHQKEPYLPMELATFTHLLGNRELTKQYSKNVQEILEIPYLRNYNLRQYLAKKHLIQIDLKAFDPSLDNSDKLGMFFKVKNDFYRFPHLALSRLALLKKIADFNTFTLIDKLKKLGVITEIGNKNLKELMSIVLFMRLKTYFHYQAQQEIMDPLNKPFECKDLSLAKKHFVLDQKALEKIRRIYCIFISFYQAFIDFLAGHEENLQFSDLEDSSPQTQGDISLRLFQHEEAKSYYQLAEEENPNNPQVLSNLGFIYQQEGNFDKANEYVKKALAIELNLGGRNYQQIAQFYNNLGTIYKEQGNLEWATEYIKKALCIGLRLYDENHPLMANFYNNLGIVYKEKGHLDKAAEYVNKALAIDLKLFGENHPTIATDYNNLGTIYKGQGNLKLAGKYAKQALAIGSKFLGENHPTLAVIYNNLGTIYSKQGDLKQATKYVKQALTIELKLYGENHPTLAVIHNNLGMIYQKRGEVKKAADHATKALSIDP